MWNAHNKNTQTNRKAQTSDKCGMMTFAALNALIDKIIIKEKQDICNIGIFCLQNHRQGTKANHLQELDLEIQQSAPKKHHRWLFEECLAK